LLASGPAERRSYADLGRATGMSASEAHQATRRGVLAGLLAPAAGMLLALEQAGLAIYERLKARSIELTHSQYAIPLLDQAFRKPVFTSGHLDFGKGAPSKQAIANLLRALRDGGVLKVVREGSGRRPTVYALTELVHACEGREVL